MSDSLYQIDSRIEDVIESGFSLDPETGEVWDSSDLDDLAIAKAEKMEACGLWLKGQARLAEGMRDEERALAERRRAVERRMARMQSYLAGYVTREPKRRFETPRVALGLRRSQSVVVTDESLVPSEYIKVKRTESVDKSAVRAALKSGEIVPGCAMAETESLQVK